MNGRRFICEEIAKGVPYSVDEVYEIYEYVRNKIVEVKHIVSINELMTTVKEVLRFSAVFQIEPMKIAKFIFPEKDND